MEKKDPLWWLTIYPEQDETEDQQPDEDCPPGALDKKEPAPGASTPPNP